MENMKNVTQKYRKVKDGTLIGDIFIYVIVAFMCFICLYPMYYVLVISLSDPVFASTMRVYWLPKSNNGIYLGAYERLVTDMNMWMAYINTIIYTAVPTVLMLITCSLFAYPLTCPRLLGKKYVNMFLLIPMYFSGGLIPTFILMTKLGLYNSRLSMIIPAAFNIWYIILVRTYFASIPEGLREAARIDGANNYQILGRIYLPNAKPILAVIAIYTMVSRWNSWYDALLYVPNVKIQPLQLYLRRVLVEGSVNLAAMTSLTTEDMKAIAMKQLSNDQLKYAMIIFTTLPIIFAYPFLQKYFVKGVMVGSLKG